MSAEVSKRRRLDNDGSYERIIARCKTKGQTPKEGEIVLLHPKYPHWHLKNQTRAIQLCIMKFLDCIPPRHGQSFPVRDPLPLSDDRPAKDQSDLANYLSSYRINLTQAERREILNHQTDNMSVIHDPSYLLYAYHRLVKLPLTTVIRVYLAQANIPGSLFQIMLPAAPQLRSVTLKNVTLRGNQPLGDPHLLLLANSCRDLREVRLIKLPGITDTAIIAIAQFCKEMTLLDTSHCKTTSASLIALGRYAKNLTTLITRFCKRFIEPDQESFNQNITKSGFAEVARGCPLEVLDISGCHVNDPTLREIGKSRTLRSFTASQCDVTDEMVDEFCKQKPPVVHLDFEGCDQLTDDAMDRIAHQLPTVTSLNLAECSDITYVGAKALSSLDLRSLSLAEVRNTTDESLKALAKCIHLRSLNLFGCDKVTNVGVLALAKDCHDLRRVNLGKTKVTSTAMSSLARANPNLECLVRSSKAKPLIITLDANKIEKDLRQPHRRGGYRKKS